MQTSLQRHRKGPMEFSLNYTGMNALQQPSIGLYIQQIKINALYDSIPTTISETLRKLHCLTADASQ